MVGCFTDFPPKTHDGFRSTITTEFHSPELPEMSLKCLFYLAIITRIKRKVTGTENRLRE